MLNKFITKVLLKLVAAFHAAIGPYVMLIVGTIILLALLFKDQIKELIPVFGKILNVVADVLDSVKGPLGELLVRIVSLVTSIYEAIGNVLAAALNGVAAILNGLVSLVTHIVSTVDTVWNLLSDVLITLLTPIRDVVVALQPVFEGMVNLLKRFIDNPVGTAVDVCKSIVGGMKSLVGGLFGSDTVVSPDFAALAT
jgi:phage-related minor tail protein